MSVDVSVIIVNYKTLDLLQNCINSVLELSHGINLQIIVVDNDSNDGSEAIIRYSYPDVSFIQSGSNLGFGRANNLGLKVAKGRNIFFLNSDTILLNNAIKLLSDYLDDHANVGVCGGNLFDQNLDPTHSYTTRFPGIYTELDEILFRKLSTLRHNKLDKYRTSQCPTNVAYICGADMMVKATVFDKTGGFDPDFFLYFEETELSWRITKEGYDIVNVPDAKIMHLEGGSLKSSYSKIKFYNSSRKKYYRKRYNRLGFLCVSSLFVFKCLLALFKNVLFVNPEKIVMWYRELVTYSLQSE